MPDSQWQPGRDVRTRERSDTARARAPLQTSETDNALPTDRRRSTKQLADVCHELRQPLQTLFLLQSLLAKSVKGAAAQKLVARVDVSLVAMAAILDGLAMPVPSRQDDHDPEVRPGPADMARVPQSEARPDALVSGLLAPTIFIVDDDDELRAALRSVLEDDGHGVRDFASCEAFLAYDRHGGEGCLLVDAYLPGMSGLELLQQLHTSGHTLPAIMITGQSDVPMAVDAMKAGAADFIEKPIGRDGLLACIRRAVEQSRDLAARSLWQQEAEQLVAGLTARQREIMDLVLAGVPNKIIAADLGISQRTVENHRATIMVKTGAKSLPALVRLAVAAA